MSVFCKFFKRIIIIFDKTTWLVAQWNEALLKRLNTVDWKILKTIIFDKNRKFLDDMWFVIFQRLEVKLLYFIAYHSQTNEQSERTNQTIEIAFRFHLTTMKTPAKWSLILVKIQRYFNNVVSTTITKTLNETFYDFTSIQSFSLWRQVVDLKKSFEKLTGKSFANVFFSAAARVKIKIIYFIAFAQMSAKHHYDRSYQPLFMKFKNNVYIRFHKNYDISAIAILSFKYSQQYVESFKILKKIRRLTYRLKLSTHWRIHSMLFVVQLKFCFDSVVDSFSRSRSNQSNSIFVERNIERVKS